MTQEQKKLLFKDICARLPFGVKGQYLNSNDPLLKAVTISYGSLSKSDGMVMDGSLVPWLFPLSSITEKQKNELMDMAWSFDDDNSRICNILECIGTYRAYVDHSCCFELIDWLNKNHFDYRGLIPMGLAEDATGLNIY